MVTQLTRNIDRACKDLNGGIETIYLLPYIKYSRSQMTIENQKLVAFPGSNIYKVYANGSSFTETSETEGGAVSFSQSFNVDVPKTEEANQVYTLVKQKYRAIYKDFNGNWRMLGLFNGLDATYTNSTGTEIGDFSGYKVTFEGKEDRQAIYMNGITEGMTPTEIENFIFQGGANYNFQGGNNYILN
jgi:hypothetical protein